ncbi:MAG: hypothetical protein OEY97_10925 [Nitrospirota bacterium]|nr:hypothetical protein [Nitrospirota bacterium]
MKRSSSFIVAVALAAALVGTQSMTAAAYSEFDAKRVSDGLNAAYATARQVDRSMVEGDPQMALNAIRQALKTVDTQLADAEKLVAADDAVAPGIQHVRANIATMLATNDPARWGTLMDESMLELYALSIDGTIVEALAHLSTASDAARDGRTADLGAALQKAGHALDVATGKGGYHTQNDLDAVQQTLLDLSSGQTVAGDVIQERIDEVRSHLFDVRAEQ